MTLSPTEQQRRNELLAQDLKRCTKCGNIKPVSEFNKRKTASDGLRCSCKACDLGYHTSYRGVAENREREKATHREWKAKNREHERQYMKEWVENNRVLMQTLRRDWHLRHKEAENAKARERMKQWVVENAEQHRNNSHLRRSREAGSDGSYTLEQWEHLLSFFDGICPRCGQKRKLTRDHIIPLKWGGSTYISNLQPICKQCNSEKGDHAAVDYRPPPARAWAYLESIPWQPVCLEPLPNPQRTEERLALND